MAHILEYTLSLQDKFSAKLQQIGVNTYAALGIFAKLQQQTVSVNSIISGMGNSVGTLSQKLGLLKQERDWIPEENIDDIKRYNSEINKLEDKIQRLQTVNPGSGLKKIAGESGKLSGSFQDLRRRIDSLKAEREILPISGLATVRAYTSEINKLEGKLGRLTKLNGSPVKTMFKDALSNIPFADLATNPLVAGAAVFVGAVKEGFKNDMAGVAFETLLGDKAKAKGMVAGIRQYANVSPYENMPMQENAKMMLAFGIASDKVLPSLKMLGDVAMGDTNKMSLLTLAFSQTASAGKLTGQDLLQMINAGFNPLQEISKMTGRSLGDLRKDMEKGSISSEMVAKAFEHATAKGGRFYGMTEKMGQSAQGQFSTLIDTAKTVLLQLYDIISPIIIPAFKAFTKIIEGVKGAIQYLVYRWQRLNELLGEGNTAAVIITSAIAGIVGVMMLHSIWTGIVTGATWLWNTAQAALNSTFWTNPVTWIIAGIIALIAAIAYVVYKTDGWAKLWDGVVAYLGMTWVAFKESFLVQWLEIQDSFLKGVELIQKAWYKVQSLWDKNGASAGLAQLSDESAKRAEEIAGHRKSVADFKSTGERALKNGIDALQWNGNRKISDGINSLKEQLGISPNGIATPEIPGLTPDDKNTGNNNANKVTDAISSGGSRSSNTTITFKNLIENIVFDGNLADKRADLEREVSSAVMRILAMAQASG